MVVRLTVKINRNRLSARGIVVYLQTTIEKQLARTQRDKRRPLLEVDAEESREVLEELASNVNRSMKRWLI